MKNSFSVYVIASRATKIEFVKLLINVHCVLAKCKEDSGRLEFEKKGGELNVENKREE